MSNLTNPIPTQSITAEIEAYLDALRVFNKAYAEAQDNPHALYKYDVTYAKAYARVTCTGSNGEGQTSAHCFIALTDNKMPLGSILKADSWKAPALNFPRGNVIGADYKITSPYGV